MLNGAYTHPYSSKKKKNTKKTKKHTHNTGTRQQGKQNSQNINRTESLRGGAVFRRVELLETEKLNHAKVARASKGKKKVCAEHLGEHNSLTGAYVGWSREQLRHAGTREKSRLSKKTTRQGRPGNPHHSPAVRGSAKHFETFPSSSALACTILKDYHSP